MEEVAGQKEATAEALLANMGAACWSAAAAAWNAWNVHFSPFCHFNYSPPSPQQVSSKQNASKI